MPMLQLKNEVPGDFHLLNTQEMPYKSKRKFLYSTVSNPQDCSKRFTLYFPDRPVQSDTISTSLGSIQPFAAINARRLFIHISTIVYSQKLAQGFNTTAQDSNLGRFSRESEALPLSHCLLSSLHRGCPIFKLKRCPMF